MNHPNLFIYFVTIGILALAGCIKCDEMPQGETTQPDYREQWTGSYAAIHECYSWGAAGTGTSTDMDTVQVEIVQGTTDSIAVGMTLVPIDSMGFYYNSPSPSSYYEVRFWADSIRIRFASGGLGGGTNCVTLGKLID